MAEVAEVLNVLRIKLAMYEGAGMDDLAKRVKARIAQLEKPAPVKSAGIKIGDTSTTKVFGNTVTKPPVKPRARKATKTSAVAKKAAVTRAAKKS